MALLTVHKAAEALAAARIRFAESFLRFRMLAPTDRQAEQQAIVETKDEITIREAELRVALWSLEAQMYEEAQCACKPARTTAYKGSAGKDNSVHS